MRIISSKTITLAALGTASVALIGVGASAAFTESTVVSAPAVSSGTFGIALENAGGAAVPAIDGNSVSFPSVSNAASNYSSVSTFDITNTGTLPVKTASLDIKLLGDRTGASRALAEQSRLTIACGGYSASDTVWNMRDQHRSITTGLVDKLEAGETASCTVTVAAVTGGLSNSAQGGSIQPQVTFNVADA